jgi:hypothetical protein
VPAGAAAEGAAEVVAALVRAGARVAAVVPAGDALEEAWLRLQQRARAEGLVG